MVTNQGNAETRGAPIKRIRDLLALSRSSEPHEAHTAQLRANELLRRYGLTENDLVERATEVSAHPDGLLGNQRAELARIIGHSRSVAVKRSGGVFQFTGYPEAAKDARDLFSVLTRIVESHCELVDARRPESDRLLWRTCFWLGFVAAIQRQLDPEHASVPQEALSAILKKTQAPVDVERAAQAFDDMRKRLGNGEQGHFEAEQFKQMAYDTGFDLGVRAVIPPYRGKR